MKKFNITIFTGGGFTKTLVIDAVKYLIADGMIMFYDDQTRLTHCYPGAITSFTIEYDEYDFN